MTLGSALGMVWMLDIAWGQDESVWMEEGHNVKWGELGDGVRPSGGPEIV